MNRLHLGKLLPHVDIHALREVAAALLAAGHTQDEVVEQVVALVDAAIPWSMLGPWGSLIEAVDGPVATALVKFILTAKRAPKV